MIKIRNLFKQILHDSFLYKKRLILSILGILISTMILNVGMILVNYQSSKNVNLLEYTKNSGVYFGPEYLFTEGCVDYELVSSVDTKIDNVIGKDSTVSINLCGVRENFLSYPIPNINVNYYLTSTELLYGEEMTEYDVLCGNRYLYLEESFCSILFIDNPLGKIVNIEGNQYIIRGVLKDSPATKRYLKSVNSKEIKIQGFTTITSVQELYKYSFVNSRIFLYDEAYDLNSVFTSNTYYSYDDACKKYKETKYNFIYDLIPIFIVTLMSMAVLETIIIIFNLKERNAEIGIKRAIGATRDEICFEFILEIVIVGLIGIVCGAASSILLNYCTMIKYYSDYFFLVNFLSIKNVFLTSGFVLGIIVISSLVPIAYIVNINIVDVVKGE